MEPESASPDQRPERPPPYVPGVSDPRVVVVGEHAELVLGWFSVFRSGCSFTAKIMVRPGSPAPSDFNFGNL